LPKSASEAESAADFGPPAGAGKGGLVEEPEQLDRDRHGQGAVLFGGDLDHGLQQP
jgi:hypothetical protein